MHVICPWSFTSLTLFNCFFKPINVLILTLRTHDIRIFGGMNSKLASENFLWKWISHGRRKWWNECSKLLLSWLNKIQLFFANFLSYLHSGYVTKIKSDTELKKHVHLNLLVKVQQKPIGSSIEHLSIMNLIWYICEVDIETTFDN